MLKFDKVCTFYGKTQVLWDVSLEVNKHEIVALIGSNGAGKTTLLNTLSGIKRLTSGMITFLNKRIDNLPINSIVEMGISYIPEGGKVFKDMTVRENLDMGAYTQRAWRVKHETIKRVYKIFPLLMERQNQLARTLSGGEQQMLAIGRGLMSVPKLCVFDEPSYGLAPILVDSIFQVIKSLRNEGITILLIEQNVKYSLETADRGYILENGRIVMCDTCFNLMQSDYIKKAYLGL